MVRSTQGPPCAHPSCRQPPRPTTPSCRTALLALRGRWNAELPGGAALGRLEGPEPFSDGAYCPFAAISAPYDDEGNSMQCQIPPAHAYSLPLPRLIRTLCASGAAGLQQEEELISMLVFVAARAGSLLAIEPRTPPQRIARPQATTEPCGDASNPKAAR